MFSQDHYALAKFGVDEIYFHPELTSHLLEKLYQRAAFSLDAENNIVQKYVSNDMVLIFYNRVPSQSLICQFIKYLGQDVNKQEFIRLNTLLNEEEFFSAIKSKKFVLVTHRTLVKDDGAVA